MNTEVSQYEQAAKRVKGVLDILKAQNEETLGFVPTLNFGALCPEAVKNVLENRQMLRSGAGDREWKAICKYIPNPEERIKKFKKFMGDE